MKTYEEFCNSNILDVILKYHNEGTSRCVEHWMRMAYDEYVDSPQLRHLPSYYLHEIRFYPPHLTAQELLQCQRLRVRDCYVDMAWDNWCWKTENYLLQKLKRTDKRDDVLIVNSKMYRKNRDVILMKYTRNKLAEANVAPPSPQLQQQSSDTPRKRSLLDYFGIRRKPISPKKRKMKLLALCNTPPSRDWCEEGSANHSGLDAVSFTSRDSFDTVVEVPAVRAKRPAADYERPCPKSKKRAAVVEKTNDTLDLDAIADRLVRKGIKIKPGPASKKRTRLERLERQTKLIEALPKLRSCPASKKPKYLAQYYEQRKQYSANITDENDKHVQILYKPLPMPKLIGAAALPPPMTRIESNTNTITSSSNTLTENNQTRIQPKGSKLWNLKNAVLDPTLCKFIIPNQPGPTDTATKANDNIQSPVAIPVAIPVDVPVVPAKGIIREPVTKLMPELGISEPPATPRRVLPCSFVTAPCSQVDLVRESEESLDAIFDRCSKEIIHPRLFQFPELIRKIKEIIFRKANPNPPGVAAPINTLRTPKLELVMCDQMYTQMSTQGGVTQQNPISVTPHKASRIVLNDSLVWVLEERSDKETVSVIEIDDNNSLLDHILSDTPAEEQRNSAAREEETEERVIEVVVERPDVQMDVQKDVQLNVQRDAQADKAVTVNEIETKPNKTETKDDVEEPPPSTSTSTPSSRLTRSKSKTPQKVMIPMKRALRYNSLPLANKKCDQPKVAAKRRHSVRRNKQGNKRTGGEQQEDIYTKVRFEESGEGNAIGIDIEEESRVVEDEEEEEEAVEGNHSSCCYTSKAAEVAVVSNQIISDHNLHSMVAFRRLKAFPAAVAASDQTEDGASNSKESRSTTHLSSLLPLSAFKTFTYNRIVRLAYARDERTDFYSDYFSRCELTCEFHLDGMRSVRLDVEMNRYLLNMTAREFTALQRLLKRVETYEYPPNETTVQVRRATASHRLITQVLDVLLQSMPKVGRSVGCVKENMGVGAVPIYMRGQPATEADGQLDLTGCIQANVLDKLADLVRQRKNTKELN